MRRALAVLLFCLALPLVAQGQSPDPDDLIRQMSTALGSLESFRFSATVGFDDVPMPDVKVKHRGSMEVSLRRSDHLRVSYRDELTAREVWVDGQTVTVLVPEEALWASAPAASSLDATFEKFSAEYGASMPLDDFLRSDPYSTLMARAKAHRYVGVTEIDGVPCHHLIVGQEDVNWQIWIEVGETKLPRQLVITYKSLPMAPEFLAVMKGWDLDPPLSDAVFRPQIPSDAVQIEFRSLERVQP
jgi:hypothetical protein